MSTGKTAGTERRKTTGPVLFECGFRPFFLGAGIYAAMAVLTSVPSWTGRRPVAGRLLAVLFGLRLAARPASWLSGFSIYGRPRNWINRTMQASQRG